MQGSRAGRACQGICLPSLLAFPKVSCDMTHQPAQECGGLSILRPIPDVIDSFIAVSTHALRVPSALQAAGEPEG